MSETISIKKLKRIMYRALRWRLQLPDYVPHNPIPDDHSLSTFSRGVVTAYRDLLEEIEKIENAENQRRIWRWRKDDASLYSGYGTDDDDESFVDEMRWKR